METSKSVLAALPEKTRALFESIRNAEGIEKFLLIGGTALALRLQHRMSEDFDFVTVGKLDKDAIQQVLGHLHRKGRRQFKKIVKPLQALEFDMAGANIEDYGQDWRVDGVKLTFFAKRFDDPIAQRAYEERMQSEPVPGLNSGRLRIATERFIFATKSQVISERLVSRDLFDLKTLIETGRFSIADLMSEAQAMGANADLTRERLVNGKLRTDDAPVNLASGQRVDIELVRNWFTEQVNAYERDVAQSAARTRRR